MSRGLIYNIKEYRNENKDKIKEASKEYYQKNKDKIKETKKEYREENKDKIKETKNEYYQKNIDKIKERNNAINSCEYCGKNYIHTNKSRHRKTKKCDYAFNLYCFIHS